MYSAGIAGDKEGFYCYNCGSQFIRPITPDPADILPSILQDETKKVTDALSSNSQNSANAQNSQTAETAPLPNTQPVTPSIPKETTAEELVEALLSDPALGSVPIPVPKPTAFRVPEPDNSVYCPDCGTKIKNPNALFCPTCGKNLKEKKIPDTPLVQVNVPPPPKPAPPLNPIPGVTTSVVVEPEPKQETTPENKQNNSANINPNTQNTQSAQQAFAGSFPNSAPNSEKSADFNNPAPAFSSAPVVANAPSEEVRNQLQAAFRSDQAPEIISKTFSSSDFDYEVIDFRPKKGKKIAIFSAVFLALAGAITAVSILVIKPNMTYNDAKDLLKSEKYEQAAVAFMDLDDYKDSSTKMLDAYNAIVDRGNYSVAWDLLDKLNFSDKNQKRNDLADMWVESYLLDNKYEEAYNLVAKIKTTNGEAKAKTVAENIATKWIQSYTSKSDYATAIATVDRIDINAEFKTNTKKQIGETWVDSFYSKANYKEAWNAYQQSGLSDEDLKKKIGNDWLKTSKEDRDFPSWLEALDIVNPSDIATQKVALADEWIAQTLTDGDYQTAFDVTNKINLTDKTQRQMDILSENILAYCSNQLSIQLVYPKTFKIERAYVIADSETQPTYENFSLVCIEFTGKNMNTQTVTAYGVYTYDPNTKNYVMQAWLENLIPVAVLPTDDQATIDRKSQQNHAINIYSQTINYINQNVSTPYDDAGDRRINALISTEKFTYANQVRLINLAG
jgi:hypothetical protein